jgi:hypothetical protein
MHIYFLPGKSSRVFPQSYPHNPQLGVAKSNKTKKLKNLIDPELSTELSPLSTVEERNSRNKEKGRAI